MSNADDVIGGALADGLLRIELSGLRVGREEIAAAGPSGGAHRQERR